MAHNEPTSAVEVTIYCPVEGEIGGVRSKGDPPHTDTHTTHVLHRCSGLLQPMGSTGCSVFGST
jgi:hypothetical protein